MAFIDLNLVRLVDLGRPLNNSLRGAVISVIFGTNR